MGSNEGELFRTVFARATDAMLVADDSARYVEANPAACLLTGFHRDELLGKTVFDLTPGGELAQGAAMWRAFLERGELAGEYRLGRRDGSFVDVEFRAVARVAPGRHLSILRDVSERKRLEQAREELLAKEVGVRRMQERLLAVASHDLRTPLTAIVLSAQALAKQLAEPAQLRHVDRIVRSGRRMEELIIELLDYVRATAGGGIQITRQPSDAHALTGATIEELRAAYPASRIDLEVDGAALGQWDPNRLQQIVSNLVVNALTHGEPNGVVRVRSVAAPDAWVMSVQNRGPAIPPELLPGIFEPFRAGAGGVGLGLGLGLYIVQTIARAHDGAVTVESSEPDGTRFSVRLPYAR